MPRKSKQIEELILQAEVSVKCLDIFPELATCKYALEKMRSASG